MKRLVQKVIFNSVVIFLSFPCFSQQKIKDEEYKKIRTFISKAIFPFEKGEVFSYIFFINVSVNKDKKTESLSFSKNTPSEFQSKLQPLKALDIKWDRIVNFGKAEVERLIIPVYYLKERSTGAVTFRSVMDFGTDSFKFTDGYDIILKQLNGVCFLPAVFIKTYADPLNERIIDSTYIK